MSPSRGGWRRRRDAPLSSTPTTANTKNMLRHHRARSPSFLSVVVVVMAFFVLSPPSPCDAQTTTNDAPPAPGANVTAAPPPPMKSLAQLMALTERRVLDTPRFLKPADQCYPLQLKPPNLMGTADRFFLLPPGKTWGNLPFTAFNLTDEDFSLGPSEPAPKGPDELIVDFELITTPFGSNVTTADITMSHLYGTSKATTYRVLPSSDFAMVVDIETTQWKAVNRTHPDFKDDLLLTMLTAPNVTVIMRPDTAGTYQMLVTVVDACNSTVQSLTNVTV